MSYPTVDPLLYNRNGEIEHKPLKTNQLPYGRSHAGGEKGLAQGGKGGPVLGLLEGAANHPPLLLVVPAEGPGHSSERSVRV